MIVNIGTRSSRLALAQTKIVEEQLHSYVSDLLACKINYEICDELRADLVAGFTINVIKIKTTGDRMLETSLKEIGGKGLFIKEIEEELLNNNIDIAVHSLKDMPAELHDDLELSCFLKREDPSDAWISSSGKSLFTIPSGARVGTCSSRRAAFINELRGDLEIVELRGNVETRLAKMHNGIVDAVILAYAGLERLGLTECVTEKLSLKDFIPAVGQGTIVIETRKSNTDSVTGKLKKNIKLKFLRDALLYMNDRKTMICSLAERKFLHDIGGDCTTPMAGYAYFDGIFDENTSSNKLHFNSMLSITCDNTCDNNVKNAVKRISISADIKEINEAITLGARAASMVK